MRATDVGQFDVERLHGDGCTGVDFDGLDSVVRDRHDRERRREPRLLVQRAAPLHAGHFPVVTERHVEAVRDERQIEFGSCMCEHLVATIGTARDDRRGVSTGRRSDDCAVRLRVRSRSSAEFEQR